MNQHHVVCLNNEVHRPVGPWTQQVHKLLHSLRAQGFCAAPEPLGFDEQGREMVSFLKGETSHIPPTSLKALISAAKLLRAYHDASQNFLDDSVSQQGWMLPCKNPQEVMCHGDFAPYNVVFDGEQAVGIIDFDTAHPGPRAWDMAYALYRFAPFTNPHNEEGFGNIEDQILRGRLFCNAYELAEDKRRGIANLMIERLQELVDFMMKSAQEGNKKFMLTVQESHHLKYLADMDYIQMHKRRIEKGLESEV
jgi:Ser/Thr protein kinase RdoA (MazF antagonist)